MPAVGLGEDKPGEMDRFVALIRQDAIAPDRREYFLLDSLFEQVARRGSRATGPRSILRRPDLVLSAHAQVTVQLSDLLVDGQHGSLSVQALSGRSAFLAGTETVQGDQLVPGRNPVPGRFIQEAADLPGLPRFHFRGIQFGRSDAKDRIL